MKSKLFLSVISVISLLFVGCSQCTTKRDYEELPIEGNGLTNDLDSITGLDFPPLKKVKGTVTTNQQPPEEKWILVPTETLNYKLVSQIDSLCKVESCVWKKRDEGSYFLTILRPYDEDTTTIDYTTKVRYYNKAKKLFPEEVFTIYIYPQGDTIEFVKTFPE